MLSQLATFLKESGLRLVGADATPVRKIEAKDGESEAVERNRKVNERANSLRSRVMDEEMKEEEKDAKKPDDEEDDPDKKDIKKKGEDASPMSAKDARELRQAIDSLTRTVSRATAQDAECDCDMKDGKHAKDCASMDKEGKDADLIPVATLHGDEVPQNPIPGADEALASLRKMRPFIAQHGTQEAKDSFNEAVIRLKRGMATETRDGYGDLLNGRKKPDAVTDAENKSNVSRLSAGDSAARAKEDFVDMAAQFHRQNPTQVKLEKKQVN